MQDFYAALKVLLENRIVPTITGLVMGVLIYAFSSDSNWLLIKLGNTGYVLVWAGIVFLMVTFFQSILKKIPRWWDKYLEKLEDVEIKEKRNAELIERLWFFLDEQDQEYIDFLKRFIDNNNDCIEETIDYAPGYKHECFDSREIILRREMVIDGEVKIIYKMDDVIFGLLKESKEKYKRINHFE